MGMDILFSLGSLLLCQPIDQWFTGRQIDMKREGIDKQPDRLIDAIDAVCPSVVYATNDDVGQTAGFCQDKRIESHQNAGLRQSVLTGELLKLLIQGWIKRKVQRPRACLRNSRW